MVYMFGLNPAASIILSCILKPLLYCIMEESNSDLNRRKGVICMLLGNFALSDIYFSAFDSLLLSRAFFHMML